MGAGPKKRRDLEDLISLRDWLRYAVSKFTEAKLVYGHGTDNALDEAAFLLLSALHLPVDHLDPWLDCRLTGDERALIRDLIEKRVTTRKPAPYLVNAAWIQGRRFYVDERVIVPRSYIGELLCRDALSPIVTEPDRVRTVLELCSGSGCLAILAAEAFPNAKITATDFSKDALDVAKRNVSEHGFETRIVLIKSDLFEDVPDMAYDLIIANPPYVTSKAVSAFPAEYRAEPSLAHDGGPDGLNLVRKILDHAPRYLSQHGVLIVEVGQARGALERAYPQIPFVWLDTEASQGEVFAINAEDFAASKPAQTGPKVKHKRTV